MAAIANAVFEVSTYTINHGLESHILYSHLQLQSSVQLKPALICSHTWHLAPIVHQTFSVPSQQDSLLLSDSWMFSGKHIKSGVINVAGPSISCEILSAVLYANITVWSPHE